MKPSLTDALCTRCGLCCDGSLFADVELTGPREAERLEGLGLRIEDDDAESELMLLPCAALKGTRCSVYAHRPACCRTFECGLLQRTRRGRVSVESALVHITEARRRIGAVHRLLESLGDSHPQLPLKERCAELLATEPRGGSTDRRRRTALEARLGEVEALIRAQFLSAEGTGATRAR
ncbi:MAG: YkgJ family cysteine cluster protein [Candidatus Eisenbacteria bacterium]|uniref:YkgJ family cysteine cluster protein n=1 Tax=Eiseniibacteriota bacterium TaxID=2212470 RepID=A0A849SJR6_UNCEI|nr:YkgJ family cysteine cluster protein [Candidatus Eisenbacteria bacterium]